MKGRPSSSRPESYTSTMYGLFTLAAARASRKKRSMTIVEAASSEARTLTATFFPSESCSASYTAAMPPRPISRATRYLPTRMVPTGIFDSVDATSRRKCYAVSRRNEKAYRTVVAAEERENTNRQARFAAIGEIAAEVAHELRNALQIISANVFLAKQNLVGSEPHLAKIERSARLAHSIVD